ncbi:hypothetical protein NHH03_22405 [Stieleria sp. TO1_6]|uniref:hypothetical protein n=1 Tax=Stieleria tagensis TaxID=2956795 RepID=UPI00209B2CE1|nr:hypothetical protein [Stieleria tagensis]MCO8124508.1 hypothetical protein [Stieleria tagensis]
MKVTTTTCGVRVQASTAKENAVVTVMVQLLAMAAGVTDEEQSRHSVQQGPDATWRNWVEIPSRLYYGPLKQASGTPTR